jgi:hypothetical protein
VTWVADAGAAVFWAFWVPVDFLFFELDEPGAGLAEKLEVPGMGELGSFLLLLDVAQLAEADCLPRVLDWGCASDGGVSLPGCDDDGGGWVAPFVGGAVDSNSISTSSA